MIDGLIIEDELSQITERLYLGGINQANNIELLKEHGITVIFTVCNYAPKRGRAEPFWRVHIPLNDGVVNDQRTFDMAADILLNLISFSEQKILIHCRAGVSRAPTVLAAALSVYHGIDSFDESIEWLRKKRHFIAPHPNLRINALRNLMEVAR